MAHRVSLFVTCVVDQLFPKVGLAMAEVLERIGLKDRQHLPARVLSAGQRRRLALTRLLTSKATLWILDEVLTSLDDAAVRLSRDFISDHIKNGGMAIVATHQDLNLSVERMQRIQLFP